jgi:hypothetical protein
VIAYSCERIYNVACHVDEAQKSGGEIVQT